MAFLSSLKMLYFANRRHFIFITSLTDMFLCFKLLCNILCIILLWSNIHLTQEAFAAENYSLYQQCLFHIGQHFRFLLLSFFFPTQFNKSFETLLKKSSFGLDKIKALYFNLDSANVFNGTFSKARQIWFSSNTQYLFKFF